MTHRSITLLAGLAIVVAVATAYSNSFSGPFIFDDLAAIQENESIRNLRSSEILIPPGKITVARRPLTNLSFAVNYAIGKLAVRSYHVGNLIIHLLAALTLFGIIRRTLLLPILCDRFGAASTGLATVIAMIWALHPLQTESVTYIVQRAESLMGLCYLLTLYAMVRGASSERPWPWYSSSIIACALGMGSKEVMATAPIVALIYDRVFLSGTFRETFRRRGTLYLGLAATWGVLVAILLLYKGPAGAGFGIKSVTPWHYALTEPGVILYYLRLSFWPQPLCLDYFWPFATSFRQVAPEMIALAALLAATPWALVRRPALGFLGAWFFLILAPTSSVMPIKDACFEHRMYLSLAAPVTAAVLAAYMVAERLLRGPGESQEARKRLALEITALLALCAAAGLGAITFQRNAQYHSEISIWKDAVGKRHENPRAWSNLGVAYVRAGLSNEAIRDYDEAIALKPDFATAYFDRAIACAQAGRFNEALSDYDEDLKLNPDDAEAYSKRGNVYAQLDRPSDAIRDYDKAIVLNADLAEAYENRGVGYAQSAHLAEALRDFDKLIALRPDYAAAYYDRGGVYIRSARLSEAVRDFNKAIALKPDYAAAYNNRAVAHYQMKAYDQAWLDVAALQKFGGRPSPGFIKALQQASGRN